MLLRDPLFCTKVKRLQVEHRLVYEVTDKEDNDLDWLLWKARDAENIRSFFKVR
jgi:hypothetical protein